jgi:uncharacterized protein (TIRG00374 family)
MGGMMVSLGLLLSVVCIGVFAFKADWHAVGAAFADLDPGFVALAAVAILMSLVARAWRWRFLLGPRRVTSFRHRLSTTAIGFMGNSIFPGRLGEPLRCFMLSKLEPGVTFTAALATIVMERVFDLAATLVALVIFLVLAPLAAGTPGDHPELFERLRLFGWVFTAALVVACAVLLVLARSGARGVRRLLPEMVARPLATLLASFADGLESLRSLAALYGSLLTTGLVWLSIMLSNYFMMRAFALDALGLVHALGLMVVLCFAVALPQAPGYVGVFQIASERTLAGLYDVPVARAQAFAIALWACHVVPMIAAGMVALWLEGLTFADVRSGRAIAGRRTVTDA